MLLKSSPFAPCSLPPCGGSSPPLPRPSKTAAARNRRLVQTLHCGSLAHTVLIVLRVPLPEVGRSTFSPSRVCKQATAHQSQGQKHWAPSPLAGISIVLMSHSKTLPVQNGVQILCRRVRAQKGSNKGRTLARPFLVHIVLVKPSRQGWSTGGRYPPGRADRGNPSARPQKCLPRWLRACPA